MTPTTTSVSPLAPAHGSVRLANPRRTTLAALRAGTRCEVAGPACRGTATRLQKTEDGSRHTCSACATR